MHVCLCADPWCRENGCRILRDQQRFPHDQEPFKPTSPAPIITHVHGCICPVGAEKTCKGAFCPRRKYKSPRKPKIKK